MTTILPLLWLAAQARRLAEPIGVLEGTVMPMFARSGAYVPVLTGFLLFTAPGCDSSSNDSRDGGDASVGRPQGSGGNQNGNGGAVGTGSRDGTGAIGGAAPSTGGKSSAGGTSGSGGKSSAGGASSAIDASAAGGAVGTDAGTDSSVPPENDGIKTPFAVGSHLNEVPMYGLMHAAGVQMIRVDVSWDQVEASQGTFTWSDVDAAMAEAAAQHLEVLVVLGYTNAWATSASGQPGDLHNYAPREQFDDEWGNYVQKVAEHCANQVAAWEIWNEPDHDNFLKNGADTWASNHYPSESSVDKKRREYKHLLDIALAQPALAGKVVTTSGFAEGGGYDTGMRGWLASQSGFLNQFTVASFHCYGYPSYQRLVDVPASYRTTQSAIGKANPWPFWITEHGLNMPGIAAATTKTYLIRSFATALAQPNVEKLFWFRAGYDPDHTDLFDQSRNPTPAYDAFKTLTGKWTDPKSITAWSSGTARGSIATLASGKRAAIVWNDGAGVPLSALGLAIGSAYDQDGAMIATNSSLTAAPVFLNLND